MQLAALIPAHVLPPAPPARLATPLKCDAGAGAAGQGDEGGDEDGEGGGTAAGRAPKPLIGVRPPAWQRFAAPIPAQIPATAGTAGWAGRAAPDGRARVAIVLDDMGLSQFRSDRAIALPRPITLAILP